MLYLAWNNGWKIIWPIFGSANQLLAALSLIVVSIWLANKSRKYWFARLFQLS
ncbi:carbon starvation CstA family protein [Desulfosporosinus fructosivorans]